MVGQPGFFDLSNRYEALSAAVSRGWKVGELMADKIVSMTPDSRRCGYHGSAWHQTASRHQGGLASV